MCAMIICVKIFTLKDQSESEKLLLWPVWLIFQASTGVPLHYKAGIILRIINLRFFWKHIFVGKNKHQDVHPGEKSFKICGIIAVSKRMAWLCQQQWSGDRLPEWTVQIPAALQLPILWFCRGIGQVAVCLSGSLVKHQSILRWLTVTDKMLLLKWAVELCLEESVKCLVRVIFFYDQCHHAWMLEMLGMLEMFQQDFKPCHNCIPPKTMIFVTYLFVVFFPNRSKSGKKCANWLNFRLHQGSKFHRIIPNFMIQAGSSKRRRGRWKNRETPLEMLFNLIQQFPKIHWTIRFGNEPKNLTYSSLQKADLDLFTSAERVRRLSWRHVLFVCSAWCFFMTGTRCFVFCFSYCFFFMVIINTLQSSNQSDLKLIVLCCTVDQWFNCCLI